MAKDDIKFSEERRAVSKRVNKCEETAHELHQIADKLHKKIKKMHVEATASHERARAGRKQAQARGLIAKGALPKGPRAS